MPLCFTATNCTGSRAIFSIVGLRVELKRSSAFAFQERRMSLPRISTQSNLLLFEQALTKFNGNLCFFGVAQNMTKVFLMLPCTNFFSTLSTLNLTVLQSGLH